MTLRTLILACILALASFAAAAQVSVSVVPVNGSQIDATSVYPDVQMRLRATRGGQPITLTTKNVVILEGNIPVIPRTVTAEGGGTYTVRWKLSRRNGQTTNDDFNTIYVTDGGVTGSTTAMYNRMDFPHMKVLDSMGRPVPRFIDLGRVPAGTTQITKYRLFPYSAPKDGRPPEERRMLLESIESRSGTIRMEWLSSFIDRIPAPPTNVLSPIEYRFNLHFTPMNNEPLLDTLIVTYEGGLTERVIIFANQRGYDRVQRLKLITPNGGQSFAPCQDVEIRWTGALPGFDTYIDYTTNDGRSWVRVDSTADSTYRWKVPSTPSDSVRIAVYQKYDASEPQWLTGESASATNVAMSNDGRRCVVAYRNGVIQEWDVITLQKTNKYQSSPSSAIVGLCYVGMTHDVVALLDRVSGADGLQRFTEGQTTPAVSVDLPVGIDVRDLGVDPTGTDVYVTPKFAPQLVVRDARTLAERPSFTYDTPVTAAVVNGDELAVMLLDGTLLRYEVPSRREVDRFETGLVSARGPLITRLALAPSRRFVAFAGLNAPSSFSPVDQMTYVADLQDRRLIRVFQSQIGTDMANLVFSASDAYLLLGYQANPQFLVYDLASSTSLGTEGRGFAGMLQDMEFGPDGSKLISCSSDNGLRNNTLLQSFATPERDISDAVFRIAAPDIVVRTLTMPEQRIGTSGTVTSTAELCNNGVVPWIIDQATLRVGTWLRLQDTLAGDTVRPGQCLRVQLVALPLDTGWLDDTLEVVACAVRTVLPIRLYSRDRDLTMVADMSDFGEVCVGSASRRRLAMVRNNDDIPVTINAVFAEGGLRSQFRVVDAVQDVVIQPGASMQVEVEFAPINVGADTGIIIVRYAGSESVRLRVRLLGRGTGADLSTSHDVLPFIPEITERDLIIRNASDNGVQVTRAMISANVPFTVLTTLPYTIGPRDSVAIRIRYDGGTIPDTARVVFSFAPCAIEEAVKLPAYVGSAVVTMPTVTADPRGDAIIPISVDITESVPYKGVRFVEGSFTVNPRLFLARTVEVEGGEGEIVSQDIVDDLRIVRFRIERSFDTDGVIGRIVGWAGLGEIDSSFLVLRTDERYFGSAVTTTFTNGLLRIANPDPSRRIVERAGVRIRSITPNPIDDVAHVSFTSTSAGTLGLRIVDAQGRVVQAMATDTIAAGDHVRRLELGDLLPGVYTVVITTDDGSSSATIVVL